MNKDYRKQDNLEGLSEKCSNANDRIEDTFDDFYENFSSVKKHNAPITSQVQTRSKVKSRYASHESPQYCYACLSSGRRMYRLVQYACVFNAICGKSSKKRIYVCWECLCVLRKIKEFKDRVEKAREMFNETQHLEQSKSPYSLSTLAEIKMCNIDFYCETDTQNLSYPRMHCEGYSKRHFIHIKTEKKNIITNQIFITDPLKKQAMINDDRSSDEKSFGIDGFVDVKIEHIDSVNNGSSAIDRNRTAKNNTNEAAQKTREQFVKQEITEDPTDSDPDFKPKLEEAEKKNISYSNSENKPKKTEQKRAIKINSRKKRYKITYDNSNVILVVRRLKILPKNASVWMKRERNSEFFRKLKNKCELCVKRLSRNESLQRHLETFHKETPASHTCTICKVVFQSLDKLKSHLYSHTFVLRCGFCGYLCYAKRNMLDHLGRRHRRNIECLECGDHFRFAKDFEAHYRLNHSSFKCDKCSKKFSKKERLLNHIDNNHTSKNCSQCNKTFVNAVKLIAHMKYKHEIDRSEENYCVTCGVQLNNRAQFKYHIYTSPNHATERNTPPKPKVRVKCESCSKTFCSRDAMRRHHNKVHLRMKGFCCPFCDKDFRASNVLRDHVKYVHEGVPRPRNHICHICARGFNVRKTLIHHVLTHTGEKPHQCPHCDARFVQRTAMRTHIRNRHR